MRVEVNGETREVPEDAMLSQLLDLLGLRPEAVVVERNGCVLSRTEYASTRLEADDRLEVIRFVGGG